MTLPVPTSQPGPSEQDREQVNAAFLAVFGYEKRHATQDLAAGFTLGFAAGWRARVPEGSEEQEEWGTRHLDIETCERLISFAPSRDAASASFDYLSEIWGHHAELIRRKVITTPWTPVDGDQG